MTDDELDAESDADFERAIAFVPEAVRQGAFNAAEEAFDRYLREHGHVVGLYSNVLP